MYPSLPCGSFPDFIPHMQQFRYKAIYTRAGFSLVPRLSHSGV